MKNMNIDQPTAEYIKNLSVPVPDRQFKFLFLANRKAGTHSVCRYLLKDRAVLKKDAPGDWARLMRICDVKHVFKFTIVRNPYDRCVSAFHALQQYSGKFNGHTFTSFVKDLLKHVGVKINRHFWYQHPNAFWHGRRIVNYIARLENIQNDWPRIAEIIDCEPELPHENRSDHRHYAEYYDEECRKIVGEIYQKDIKLFGYKYEKREEVF